MSDAQAQALLPPLFHDNLKAYAKGITEYRTHLFNDPDFCLTSLEMATRDHLRSRAPWVECAAAPTVGDIASWRRWHRLLTTLTGLEGADPYAPSRRAASARTTMVRRSP